MADNISVTAGSGTDVAADEVVDGTLGTVKVGFGKIMDGTLDSTNKLIVNSDGEALVKDTDATALLTTIDADTGAIKAAVEILDNAISGSEMQVDIVSGAQTDALTDAELRATPVPISGTVTSNLGTLNGAATSAKQDTIIGHVDGIETLIGTTNTTLGTIDADTGNISTKIDTIAGAVAGTEMQVDVLTMPTVTETNSAAIKTAVETIDNAISGSEMQVDVVGALPAGTNNIGDVDVLSVVPGTGATNAGKAEDGGHTTGDTGTFVLAVRQDTPNTATTNTDADYSQISVTSTGAVRPAPISEDFAALANGPQVKKYYTNAGAVTDGIIWSPAAGKRWYVTDLILNTSAAATVTLEDDKAAGDEVVMKFELAANSGVQHSFLTPLFSGEDAADLLVTTSAGNIYITVVGYEI